MLEAIWDFIIMVLVRFFCILFGLAFILYFIWGFLTAIDDRFDKKWGKW